MAGLVVAVVVAAVCMAEVGVWAVPGQLMYPFGPENGDQTLPPGDDISSDELALSVPIVFTESTFDSIYVNSNGHVSFETEIPRYQGGLVLPLGFKVIAPFLADVDTSASGRIYYRESQDSALLQKAATDVQTHFANTRAFKPRAVFIVTWDRVGYFNGQFDKVNTFQLVIVSDGSDSFVFFHYLDGGIGWTVGQGKYSPNVLDVPAQAGFDKGDGYENNGPTLPFSGTTAAFVNDSNVNIPGVWMYQIGSADGMQEIKAADLNTGEVTIYEVGGGRQTCLEGAQLCHINARCQDFENGFCCQCLPPYYGNGKQCLEPDVPQRLNGRVHGSLNGVPLNNLDMHTYVVTSDGRTYTAISRVPSALGSAMETLNTIGGSIGWLFAVPTNRQALNGFMYTGGVFNRTSVVKYQRGESTIHTARITQRFYGHDALNNLRMDTHIEGDLPAIGSDSKVSIDDYNENYKRLGPGLIKTFSVRTYRINDVAFRYTWDTTLTFEECAADTSPRPNTMRLAVTRNYVRHNNQDQVVRYAMSNKITVMSGSDPCFDASQTCHEHADCVPSDASFRCVCRAGYKGDGFDCQDIDECAMSVNVCDDNARCFNVYGSFQCQCLAGFQGDGHSCTRDQSVCGDRYCGANARCVFNPDANAPQCECNPGFRGDGVTCSAVQFGCNEADTCGENAECVFDPDLNSYECQCMDDFSGDGYSCEPVERSDCRYCSENAECVYDIDRLVYQCICRPGFTGDGITCSQIDSCGQCDANAECVFNDAERRYSCQCRYGFYGDGTSCSSYDCRDNNVCAPEATCGFDVNFNAFLCQCPAGYSGDGLQCEALGCDVTNDCSPNARCLPQSGDSRYVCQCNPGFQGDGKTCEEEVVPCNQVNNCDRHAECSYDPDALSYRCRCIRGYDGDGFTCVRRDVPDCRRNPGLCDPNASCLEGADGLYVCVCNRNYRGDGRRCEVAEQEGDRLIYARGYKLMSVSTSANSVYGQQILFLPGQLAVAVDTDCRDGRIYWTDAASGIIRRSHSNGTDIEVLMTGLGSPEGIAVDFVSRNIYYTDSKYDSLGVAQLDGSNHKTLFNTDMVNPRAIVLDMIRGNIYWTDWNRNKPQIETSRMDGSQRRVLISSDLRLPNGLAFDHYSQQLCWADAGTKRLECAQGDGIGRRIVSSEPSHPFGLAILNNILYWTDWQRKDIASVTQDGGQAGGPLQAAIGGSGRLYGITAVKDRCPRVNNACAVDNGGCAYLCLPTPGNGRQCACPDGVDPRICQDSNAS